MTSNRPTGGLFNLLFNFFKYINTQNLSGYVLIYKLFSRNANSFCFIGKIIPKSIVLLTYKTLTSFVSNLADLFQYAFPN